MNEDQNLSETPAQSGVAASNGKTVEVANANDEPTSLRKLEIEERLEKVALDGLCNLYHYITGKTCERYVSLGMATSAVSALLTHVSMPHTAVRPQGFSGRPACRVWPVLLYL
jgi:hypothetical protein